MTQTPQNTENVHADIFGNIETERARQVCEEGYDLAHDKSHEPGEFFSAAAAYLLSAAMRTGTTIFIHTVLPYRMWPWEDSTWKPKSPRSDAVRAAALVIAGLERLDRQYRGDDGPAKAQSSLPPYEKQ